MSDSAQLDRALLDLLRCAECGGILESGQERAACALCGACYPRTAGIWRMLTTAQQVEYAPFMQGYSALRAREGWVRDEAYYLSLPDVPPGDPSGAIWRIRRRSLAVLGRTVPPGSGGWALDLGAGCGWLSRYLARRGYNPVALDLNTEGPDALEGAGVYIARERVWLGRVQAAMDRLPFADASFALCTVSAALHYAPGGRVLAEVSRVLRPGGLFVITDSPVYCHAAAGRIMAAEQRARASALLDAPPAPLPGGEGYFVERQLVSTMRAAGFETRVISTESLPGRARRLLRRAVARGSREHALFPVVVGEKR